jgi:hypothetical protein
MRPKMVVVKIIIYQHFFENCCKTLAAEEIAENPDTKKILLVDG